jgi:hypothetical protein
MRYALITWHVLPVTFFVGVDDELIVEQVKVSANAPTRTSTR